MPRYPFTRPQSKRLRFRPIVGSRPRGGTIGMVAKSSYVRRMRMRRPRYRNYRTGGFLGHEVKYYDLNYSGALSSTAAMTGAEADPATILCLNGVPQGDTMSTRDGQKMAMKSIFLTGTINVPDQAAGTTLNNDCTVFVALVLDTQTNGAQLNSEDVFTNTRSGTDGFLTTSPLRNMQYTERFKVLATRTLRFPQLSTVNNATANTIMISGCKVPFTLKANLKGLQTKFTNSATTGVVGTIVDNSLHVIAFANNDDYVASMIYQSRLRFYDH